MLLASAAIPAGVHAQTKAKTSGAAATPIPGLNLTPAPDNKPGYKVGSFRLYPEFEVSEIYNNNIFATQTNMTHDFITRLSPSLELRSEWTQHALNFRAGADIDFYKRHSSENTQDVWAGFDGRYDFDRTANLFGGFTFSRNHEDRGSPDDVAGSEPTIYYEYDAHLGLLKQFGRWTVRVGGTLTRLNFMDVPATTGTINNNDRDRFVATVGSRITYNFAPGYAVFAQGAADLRWYDNRPDDNGFDRNSAGFNSAIGLSFRIGRTLSGEIYAGYLYQNYRDVGLKSAQGLDFGGYIDWRIAGDLTVTAYADRSVEETTLAGASAYIYSRFGGRIAYDATDNLRLATGFSVAQSRYVGISRTDHTTSAYAFARYRLSRWAYLGGEFRWTRRNSDVPGASYTENRAMITLGTDFGANKDLPVVPRTGPDSSAMWTAAHASIFSGPYVGISLGRSSLLTNVDGVRGPNRPYDVDFGDTGFTPGGFAGYGLVFDRVYVGLEMMGRGSFAGWDHSRLPGGRVFSMDETYSVSGALRAGYAHKDIALFYASIGLVRTGFDIYYLNGTTATEEKQSRTGLRLAGGFEVPLSQSVFARMEYAYNRYGRVDVNYSGGIDTFNPSSSVFLVGLGWRFNGDTKATPESDARKPEDFRGFYTGAQIGFGTLTTQTSGARNAGSQLKADMAGHGFTGGALAGYGYTLGYVYFGVEGEIDGSTARWRLFRASPSRDITIRKQWSLGGAARIGYIFRNVALVYAKAGVVHTWFSTRYANNGVTVTPNEGAMGVRIGGGIEVPLGGKVFTRLEYTHTHYASFDIPYNGGTDSFRNREDLVRVALLYRF